jgi:hypothetical protein
MGPIVVVLVLALALAAVVMVYAAYPYRGEETPVSPKLGRAMRRGVRSLPTMEPRSPYRSHDASIDGADDAVPDAASRYDRVDVAG